MNLNKIFRRQLDLVRPEELDFPIAVIGAGGIGSWCVFALAKMGCPDITVIDPDKVEAKNTPSQLYTLAQVGTHKVDALDENIEAFTGSKIKREAKKWQKYYKNGYGGFKAIICTVDSIGERTDIWRELIRDWWIKRHFDCYIDARMAGELMRILVVNPYDLRSLHHYEKRLFPSKNAHKEPCTARSIVYNTFICGGMIASLIKKYAKREETKYDFIFDLKNAMVY